MAQPPHDPHLAAALRHAPDADEAPPPALSRAILQAAKEAARRPPAMPAAPSSAPFWQRWLERLQLWLQEPRLAGGAAVLMLAVLIGSLWGPAPDTSPVPQREALPLPAAAPKAEAPAEPLASAATPAPAAADAVQKAARPFATQQAEAPRRRPSAAPQAEPKAEPERRAAAPAAPPAAAAPGADPATQVAESVAAEPPSLARLHLAAAADEQAGATTARRRVEANAPRLAFAPAASPLRRWLQQLSQAAAGRWVRQPADTTLPADSATWSFAWPPGGSAPQATIRLYGRTLWWQEADGSLWRAELPSDAELTAPPEPAASAAR
jgi:hypothetical protein